MAASKQTLSKAKQNNNKKQQQQKLKRLNEGKTRSEIALACYT